MIIIRTLYKYFARILPYIAYTLQGIHYPIWQCVTFIAKVVLKP